MKKGKTSKLNGFKSVKVLYGTVDSRQIKSMYINIQTWVTPKLDWITNWQRVVLNLSRSIKHTVLENLDTNFFENTFIVDLDLRTSGIQYGKKSFMNLEINLFLKDHIDFKSPILKNLIKSIVTSVYNENILRNEYFSFYLTKKDNLELVLK